MPRPCGYPCWGAKLGRQSRGIADIFGSFDGLLGSWQARPHLGRNVIAGLPVEISRAGIDTNLRFVGVAAGFGTKSNSWDASVYAITQQYFGIADRQSIGVESRYLKPDRSRVALLDYNIHFADIDDAKVLGTLILQRIAWQMIRQGEARLRRPWLSLVMVRPVPGVSTASNCGRSADPRLWSGRDSEHFSRAIGARSHVAGDCREAGYSPRNACGISVLRNTCKLGSRSCSRAEAKCLSVANQITESKSSK